MQWGTAYSVRERVGADEELFTRRIYCTSAKVGSSQSCFALLTMFHVSPVRGMRLEMNLFLNWGLQLRDLAVCSFKRTDLSVLKLHISGEVPDSRGGFQNIAELQGTQKGSTSSSDLRNSTKIFTPKNERCWFYFQALVWEFFENRVNGWAGITKRGGGKPELGDTRAPSITIWALTVPLFTLTKALFGS